ncbi:unnamed protein product [Schistosoma turkestanicum]|nr:unnamed protein product [Schistosoma turkestanicum]
MGKGLNCLKTSTTHTTTTTTTTTTTITTTINTTYIQYDSSINSICSQNYSTVYYLFKPIYLLSYIH